MPILTFYNYNANNGGKTISVVLNNEILYLNLKQFSNIKTTFGLTGSANVYKIQNNLVVKI
jgi:hypothetical protein